MPEGGGTPSPGTEPPEAPPSGGVSGDGTLDSEALETLYNANPDQALLTLQQQFNIQLPPSFHFAFAYHNSGLFVSSGGIEPRGAVFWFFDFNWITISDPSIRDCSGIRNPRTDPNQISYIASSVFITDKAFTAYDFRPDDVAATMIHEAVHAYQQAVARDKFINGTNNFGFNPYGDVPTFDWFNDYRAGMERQASEIVIQAHNSGRIQMSTVRESFERRNLNGNRRGEDFPFALPSGVP